MQRLIFSNYNHATMINKLFEIPTHQLNTNPKKRAFGMKIKGKWEFISIQQYIDQINQLSRGLLSIGIKKGDNIGVISNNRTEWCILDMALLQIGAVNVPVYTNMSDKDYIYIFNHAEIEHCFVSNKELLDKLKNIQTKIPKLKHIYTFDKVKGSKYWKEILNKDIDKTLQDQVNELKSNTTPNDVATILYTSGTTGTPKGVMLSHKNILSNIINAIDRVPLKSEDKALSFLPICHSFERAIVYLYQYLGISVYFVESIDTVADNIKQVKPHIITAVPRLLEKIYDKIVSKGRALSGIKRKLFFWAISLGNQYNIYGKNKCWYNYKLFIARKLIFNKWKEALGGEITTIVSGSAPLQPRLAKVFNAAGIDILEGYGLSETSPVVSVNTKLLQGHFMIGTVGKPIRNIKVKICNDGEIAIKGDNVMQGYYKEKTKTKEVIDEQGYLYTGDIGEINSQGFLKITGRKKEIFKTSGGKYISPQALENDIKQSPFIEQIMVIGEAEKMPSALIQLDFDFVKKWANKKEINIGESLEEITSAPEIINAVKLEIDHYNQNFGKWEQVKKIELTPDIWSIDNGLLTPTLKIKRKQILEKYKSLYEKIYGNP